MYHSYSLHMRRSWTTSSRGKRIFDIVVAAAMLVLFTPVMLTVALMLKCSDRGPIFYGHTRVGKGGVEFQCFKFRTMATNADERLEALLKTDPEMRAEWEASRKLRHDPRIIPGIGHMLRKSSLDELPQVLNVLLGDMSVVGPRPVVEDELDRYGRYRHAYLSVRPGLTGPWQAAQRSDSTYGERVRLDADYVRNGTLMRDIVIIMMTARKFLKFNTSGAY
ncbi:sugar transferase [Loktanella sp. S4079]|uniref:sugar transferase n=1 Tax=Loktanella sp. S4079 TaxID=579483 RepID=UPI0005F9DCC7|nr:sugar transferase [Loktanella sp. S4079]